MRFSANISTLFKEFDVIERVREAKKCGFQAIEIQFPYGSEYENLPQTIMEENIDVILTNSYPGETFGNCCIPGKESEFLRDLLKSLNVSTDLKSPKLHIIAGLKNEKLTEEEQTACYIKNLQAAADILKEKNILGVIEPLCPAAKENYFLDSFDEAIKVLDAVNRENIKLMLDIYHLQEIHGNALQDVPKYYPYAGHIQISQVPGRTEPFIDGGLIDYSAVLGYLQEKNHEDYIGLEYFPSKPTKETLSWMNQYLD